MPPATPYSSSSQSANYAVVITGYTASQMSRSWGRWYIQAVAKEFDVPIGGDNGIKVGGYDGRGEVDPDAYLSWDPLGGGTKED